MELCYIDLEMDRLRAANSLLSFWKMQNYVRNFQMITDTILKLTSKPSSQKQSHEKKKKNNLMVFFFK